MKALKRENFELQTKVESFDLLESDVKKKNEKLSQQKEILRKEREATTQVHEYACFLFSLLDFSFHDLTLSYAVP